MSAQAAQPTAPPPASEDVKAATTRALRSTWLAALGIPAAAREGSGRLFHYLIEKGEKVEARGKVQLKSMSESAGRTARSVSATVGETLKDVGVKARGWAGRGEEVIDRKIAEKLNTAGVPTREELQALGQRVDEVAQRLEQMQKELQNR